MCARARVRVCVCVVLLSLSLSHRYSSFFDGWEAYGRPVPAIYNLPSSFMGNFTGVGPEADPQNEWAGQRANFKDWYGVINAPFPLSLSLASPFCFR